jgi:conjugal transfer pilus assembly protein TraL
MADPTETPKYIDAPPLILLWRVDDLVPIVLCLVIGIFTGNPGTMFKLIVLGVLLVRLYSKYRERRPDGHALHFLYWYGCCLCMGVPSPSRSVGGGYHELLAISRHLGRADAGEPGQPPDHPAALPVVQGRELRIGSDHQPDRSYRRFGTTGAGRGVVFLRGELFFPESPPSGLNIRAAKPQEHQAPEGEPPPGIQGQKAGQSQTDSGRHSKGGEPVPVRPENRSPGVEARGGRVQGMVFHGPIIAGQAINR